MVLVIPVASAETEEMTGTATAATTITATTTETISVVNPLTFAPPVLALLLDLVFAMIIHLLNIDRINLYP